MGLSGSLGLEITKEKWFCRRRSIAVSASAPDPSHDTVQAPIPFCHVHRTRKCTEEFCMLMLSTTFGEVVAARTAFSRWGVGEFGLKTHTARITVVSAIVQTEIDISSIRLKGLIGAESFVESTFGYVRLAHLRLSNCQQGAVSGLSSCQFKFCMSIYGHKSVCQRDPCRGKFLTPPF